ncbi:hypothetical protein TMatcc_001106 [Talaromyces marneffei ATCC 18224]
MYLVANLVSVRGTPSGRRVSFPHRVVTAMAAYQVKWTDYRSPTIGSASSSAAMPIDQSVNEFPDAMEDGEIRDDTVKLVSKSLLHECWKRVLITSRGKID